MRQPRHPLPPDLDEAEKAELKTAQQFSFDTDAFGKHIDEGGGILNIVIRAHLYLEHVLITLLRETFQHPDAIDLRRLSFPTKLDLCIALGLVSNELRQPISKINEMRNQVAHKLDFELTGEAKNALWLSIPMFLRRELLAWLKSGDGETDKVEFNSMFRVLVFWLDVWRQK